MVFDVPAGEDWSGRPLQEPGAFRFSRYCRKVWVPIAPVHLTAFEHAN